MAIRKSYPPNLRGGSCQNNAKMAFLKSVPIGTWLRVEILQYSNAAQQVTPAFSYDPWSSGTGPVAGPPRTPWRRRLDAGGRRQETRDKRQEAGGRRQEARDKRQEAGGRRPEAGGSVMRSTCSCSRPESPCRPGGCSPFSQTSYSFPGIVALRDVT